MSYGGRRPDTHVPSLTGGALPTLHTSASPSLLASPSRLSTLITTPSPQTTMRSTLLASTSEPLSAVSSPILRSPGVSEVATTPLVALEREGAPSESVQLGTALFTNSPETKAWVREKQLLRERRERQARLNQYPYETRTTRYATQLYQEQTPVGSTQTVAPISTDILVVGNSTLDRYERRWAGGGGYGSHSSTGRSHVDSCCSPQERKARAEEAVQAILREGERKVGAEMKVAAISRSESDARELVEEEERSHQARGQLVKKYSTIRLQIVVISAEEAGRRRMEGSFLTLHFSQVSFCRGAIQQRFQDERNILAQKEVLRSEAEARSDVRESEELAWTTLGIVRETDLLNTKKAALHNARTAIHDTAIASLTALQLRAQDAERAENLAIANFKSQKDSTTPTKASLLWDTTVPADVSLNPAGFVPSASPDFSFSMSASFY